MGKILGALALLVLDFFYMLLRGVVIADMWRWFVTPLGVPSISMVHAIGFSLFVGLFTMGTASKSNVDADFKGLRGSFTLIVAFTLVTLMVWGFGAIAHSFM